MAPCGYHSYYVGGFLQCFVFAHVSVSQCACWKVCWDSGQSAKQSASGLTFHSNTIFTSHSAFPLSSLILHCFGLHWGKCQCTHLLWVWPANRGLATPKPEMKSGSGLRTTRGDGKGELIRLGLRHLQLAGYPGMAHQSHETIWFLAWAAEPWPHLLGLQNNTGVVNTRRVEGEQDVGGEKKYTSASCG